MSTPTALPPGYLSFLLCLHGIGTDRALINAYVNGLPIGQITAAGFAPQLVGAAKRPTTFRDLADPCPFATLADLKAALHAAVDQIVLPDPQPTAPAAP